LTQGEELDNTIGSFWNPAGGISTFGVY